MTTAIVLLSIALALVAIGALVRWRRGRRTSYTPIPLVFPMNSGIAWETTMSADPQVEVVEPPPAASSFAPPPMATPRIAQERNIGVPVTVEGSNPAPATSETVRFQRPTEEVVQLLPGHLEVLSGDPRHQEIRFVRVQGQQPQLILGRNPGRSPQHIALNSSTVSRQHARLAFSGGKWAVANLSKTNPVVVNDQELSSLDGERPLRDGDRIELGEVVLRFHAH